MAAALSKSSSNSELSENDPEKIHTDKDLQYNASPIKRELHVVLDQLKVRKYIVNLKFESPTSALSQCIFICTLAWDGSKAEEPLTPLPRTHTLVSPQCSSKDTAKAFVAIRLLEMLPEQWLKLSKWKKVIHSAETPRGPLEVLNETIQQNQNLYQYQCYTEGTGINQRFKGRLTLLEDGRIVAVDYPYHKDHRYCRNKVARKALEEASFYDEKLWNCYKTIRKCDLFVFGRVFPLEEDMVVELKGGRAASTPMTEKAVMSLRTEIGKQVCAFLNSEGGSIFVGIHDEQRAIQGIKIENLDGFKLQIISSITTRLEPYKAQQVMFVFHQVKEFNHKNCKLETIVSRPAVPDKFHLHLEGQVVALERHIDSLPRISVEGNCWVMEVRASKSHEVTFFEGKAYKRDDGALRDMPVPEIRQRIIEHFKLAHNSPDF